MSSLDIYLSKNRKKAYQLAERSTPHNQDGRAILPTDDEWRGETEWDDMFEDMTKGKKF